MLVSSIFIETQIQYNDKLRIQKSQEKLSFCRENQIYHIIFVFFHLII